MDSSAAATATGSGQQYTSGAGTSVLDPNAAQGDATAAAASPGTQASPSWSKGWLKEDGSFDHSALDKAPEDLRGLKQGFERYKTVEEYLKGQRERDSLLGKKGIVEPLGKEATAEQRAERAALLRRANGAPDKPEGFAAVLTKPADLPDAMWNQEAVNAAAKIAFDTGTSPEALKQFGELQTTLTKQAVEAQQKQVEAMWSDQDKLIRDTAQKEGMTYEQARDLAERAGKRFAGIDKDNPLFKNATVMLALARIGKAMGEDTLIKGEPEKLENLSAETAAARLNDIRDNPKNPKYEAYWQKSGKQHPDHDAVVAECRALSAKAYLNRDQRTSRTIR